ncbi:MAG: GNAT family N-acetyltransferase [Bacteroidaceae bacterium]|nr:GNAT family N-acetyltransferase [Bacteroidaceae bacterium]
MKKSWLKDGDITLRAPEPEDLELMYAMENDTSMWCAGNATLPYSRYTLRAYLEQSRQDLLSERQARFVIETESGPAGMIDLADYDPLNSRAEVCIGILGCYRGKGIAARALQLLCQYATGRLHLHQLYAYIPTWNSDSIRVFEKAGFNEHSTLKDWIRDEEGYSDAILMQKVNK